MLNVHFQVPALKYTQFKAIKERNQKEANPDSWLFLPDKSESFLNQYIFIPSQFLRIYERNWILSSGIWASLWEFKNGRKFSFLLFEARNHLFVCKPLWDLAGSAPSKITSPPRRDKRSRCFAPDRRLVAAKGKEMKIEVCVVLSWWVHPAQKKALTPHSPTRFLYSSSRALSSACRAASALFESS